VDNHKDGQRFHFLYFTSIIDRSDIDCSLSSFRFFSILSQPQSDGSEKYYLVGSRDYAEHDVAWLNQQLRQWGHKGLFYFDFLDNKLHVSILFNNIYFVALSRMRDKHCSEAAF
jgi:hypothetical protein